MNAPLRWFLKLEIPNQLLPIFPVLKLDSLRREVIELRSLVRRIRVPEQLSNSLHEPGRGEPAILSFF